MHDFLPRRLRPSSLPAALLVAAAAALLPSCAPWPWENPATVDDYIGPMSAGTVPLVPATTPAPASMPASMPASRPAGQPLAVTVQESILIALENNPELAVRRLDPRIQGTFEQQEAAGFDPTLSAELSGGKTRSRRQSAAVPGALETSSVGTVGGSVGVGQVLPSGTSVDLEASSSRLDSSLYSDDLVSTRVGLSVTQALLRGAGCRVNLASLRQARLDTLASEYELRGFAEALVARIEDSYWNTALAERQVTIFADSLKLAEKQLDETQKRIHVGKLPETELVAAQAEVALRNESLINARSALATRRLELLRLLNAPGGDLWNRKIELLHQPSVPDVQLDDVEQHVAVALRMRPDLNQALLAVQRDDLETVKTSNGLLPRLDLFIALGKTGYADSFSHSVRDLDGDGYDLLAGARLEYPFGNRAAKARHSRAMLTRDQARQAVENLRQLIQVDVRSAYVEVQRAREQIAAGKATLRLQEEKVRVEELKLAAGNSTSLLVAQANRDLLASQIADVSNVVNYLKALVDLFRLEGSLLERRAIAAPGRTPVAEGE
jgi:outer membrane protein